MARREFTERLRDRAFLITNIFLIVVLVGAPLLGGLLQGDDGLTRLGAVGAEVGAVAEAALSDGDLAAVLLDARTVLVETELPEGLEPLLASAASGAALSQVLTEAGVGPQEQADLAVDTLTEPDTFDFGPSFFVGLLGIGVLYGLLFIYGRSCSASTISTSTGWGCGRRGGRAARRAARGPRCARAGGVGRRRSRSPEFGSFRFFRLGCPYLLRRADR